MSVSEDEEDTIYPWSDVEIDTSCEEIEASLSRMIGNCYPDMEPVTRSTVMKKQIAEILEYEIDGKGPRSKVWKSVKPFTFAPHKLQTRSLGMKNNLQIWGKEAHIFMDEANRVAILLMDSDECVRDVIVVTAGEISNWSGRKKVTIKHQGTIKQEAHRKLSKNPIVDNTTYGFTAKLTPLIGQHIPAAKVRTQGEYVSTLVAGAFGLTWNEDGQYPDIVLTVGNDKVGVEIKSQNDNVIDFGTNSPNSNSLSKSGHSPKEVVYVLVVINNNKITGIICSKGSDLSNVGVSVITSVHGKTQGPIPAKFFNREVELFSQPKGSVLKSICRFLRLCR